MTVHKSQGGTFSEIVFSYESCQEQQLVYVGLSRVTSIDGLYLTNPRNNFKFHHCKNVSSPRIDALRTELQRLSNHRLRTIGDDIMTEITSNSSACTLISMNVQSLNAHSLDISTDRVLTSVNFLAISETWLTNNSNPTIAGYDCIVLEKRDDTRAGGVAIFQNTTTSAITLSHTIKKFNSSDDQALDEADHFGDICAAEISMMGTNMLLFSLYISPGTTLRQKKYFLTRNLIMYARLATPIIVTGDFNIDVSKPGNDELISFMKTYLFLDLASDPTQATTLGGSCIDLTFCTEHWSLL
ncbi:uncharacterized protein LOC129739899 [Uranotaenia lowii]|uniref:uncharacterized protein LOC129739899 n=1 Tax=Uranotaenia lowii TaxID=190385 RepID=UPI002478CF2B|nr:uncharacterized protein LOC129739899 [Uranotaenia lowii]